MFKTIFLFQNHSTFVEKDLNILQEFSKVISIHVGAAKGIKAFFSNLSVAIEILFHIKKTNLIFIWFVDFHSLFPILIGKVFRIKTAVVIGGSDAVSIPPLKIGLFSSGKFRQLVGRICYSQAEILLPVDQSLIKGINKYADKTGVGFPTGFLSFNINPQGLVKVVPTGYDEYIWKYNEAVPRKNDVVSVGFAYNRTKWILKGGDLLNEVAFNMPEINFYFYGLSEAFRNQLISEYKIAPNFHLMGMVKNENLPAIFSSFKVYAQLSISEGLPNVLCEAMLCGCIPVGSNVNGIPTAIGDTGFIIEQKNVRETTTAINKALNMEESHRNKTRSRIIKHFPNSKREEALKKLFFNHPS